jgi:hypothetical protein
LFERVFQVAAVDGGVGERPASGVDEVVEPRCGFGAADTGV